MLSLGISALTSFSIWGSPFCSQGSICLPAEYINSLYYKNDHTETQV